ncbi:MAG: site-specific DNA-methyltransferase [Hyphomicrobium sp.]
MTQLTVTNVAVGSLRPCDRNARTHSPKQIAQIAASIKAFGFNNPGLIDKDGGIIAGHGRVEAAKKLGHATVPCVRLEHLTDAQKRASILADNKLAEKAGWDPEILKIELQHLNSVDLDCDVTVTGFEMAEIDVLLSDATQKADPANEVPAVEPGSAVTRLGDIWQIGAHRLICGDSTKAETYARLLDGARAQMVFTDPPYNVKIDGHVCGLGGVKHREFAMASREMTTSEFTRFLTDVFASLPAHSVDGAMHFICMDWRRMSEVLVAVQPVYSELKNLCVWAKPNGGMGSLYRSQHELVFVYKSGSAPHINNVELCKHGRYRTNVWSYAGANTFSRTRDADLEMHPTVKPVALVADAIIDCSKRNGIVLDAFGGSGTTPIAVARAGRRGFAIELDPHYCDVIVRRAEKVLACEATHADTGKTFQETSAERALSRPRSTSRRSSPNR